VHSQFTAACRGTQLHLKDGEMKKIATNVLVPVLLGVLTGTMRFHEQALITGQQPTAMLGSLVRFRAPLDAGLTDTLDRLLRHEPELPARLGAAALLHMEQQPDTDWKTYALWGGSIAVALGAGALEKPFENQTRHFLGLGREEAASGWQQGALAGSAATTSGMSEAADAWFIGAIDKLLRGESAWPDLSVPVDMLKSFIIGSLSALPSSWVTYSTAQRVTKILVSLPANLLAAVGGAAPVPLIMQARNDARRGTLVEKCREKLLAPMTLEEIGRLVDASERISHSGQLMQKGGAFVVLAGLATWALQTGKMDDGQVLALFQRALLNPMEAHTVVIGSLLAEYMSFLGATRAEKSANLLSAVVREDRALTLGEVHAIHAPGAERYIQNAGAGVLGSLNAVINGVEDAVRWTAGKVTAGRVLPHFRYRLDVPPPVAPPDVTEPQTSEQPGVTGDIQLSALPRDDGTGGPDLEAARPAT